MSDQDKYIQANESESKNGINSPKLNNWVSVKEQMPEPGSVVLVYIIECKGIDMVFYRGAKFQTFAGLTVSHWMPLPQPPKSESESKKEKNSAEIDDGVEICPDCEGGGEVAGDYFSDDNSMTCPRCHGKGEI